MEPRLGGQIAERALGRGGEVCLFPRSKRLAQVIAAGIECGNETLEFNVGKVPAHGSFAVFQSLVRDRGKELLPVGLGDRLLLGAPVEDSQYGLSLGRIELQLDTIRLLRTEKESQEAGGHYEPFHAD
jgi:hypothetical protein